jgi:hypothetical protein
MKRERPIEHAELAAVLRPQRAVLDDPHLVGRVGPRCAASSLMKVATPSEAIEPGSTMLTVTPVPRLCSASPRATASCAVFVVP